MSKMRVVVTGGSGFIGTNVVNYFLEKGYEVLNLDWNKPKDETKLAYWDKVDIVEKECFEKKMVDFMPDYIIHLAARCDLKGEKMKDYIANTKGVQNLLEICKNRKLNLKKVLITSSMLVCRAGYHPKDQKDYHPHTIYGKSKVISEKLVWKNSPTCDWAILRPTSIWGPWFDEPYRNFFDEILKRRYVHIGHKSARMTYGYVENTVSQIEAILLADTVNLENKVFYLGDYEATNLEEWANEIARESHRRIIRVPYEIVKLGALTGDLLKKVKIDFPLTTFRLTNMITDNISDLEETKKLKKELPFTRKEGVRKTLEWMREQGRMI